ncbi:hypothetical protein HN604_03945 [archaeon]|nr:hypothetical protein [archaeon]MBT6182859.1 hypothetical protein [archaeon]MBT6606738.1 hypothetical protein [archaeon]MBT7251296.1 hypothetical protein [archaeon]MBT7661202.1 hypothetical protein [archaeon]
MVSTLVGLHVAISEIGIVAFLWAFIDILNPNPERIKRAKLLALIGTVLFFISWLSGGYYYVDTYGVDVKPLIKAGPQPWAHSIIMEAKEHIFLMLPFLGFICYAFIRKYEKELAKGTNKQTRKAVLLLLGLTIFLGVLMAFFGYLISSGYRTALEALI